MDLPRSNQLDALPNSHAGACQDQFLLFGVTADEDLNLDANDLFVELAVVNPACPDFAEGLRSTAMQLPGAHEETVAGLPVIVGDQLFAWTEDGMSFLAQSEGPDSIAAMRPFLEAFIEGQATLPEVHD